MDRLLVILSAILVVNYLINSHICHLYVNVKEEIFWEPIFLRFLTCLLLFLLCLKEKRYSKIRDVFYVIDLEIIIERVSLKRIKYFKVVKYKTLFIILWLLLVLNLLLFSLSVFKFRMSDQFVGNILYYQQIIWFFEAFFLVNGQKKKGKKKGK